MKRVAVVGAGTMGAGIALAVARSNFDVILLEVDSEMRDRAQERMRNDAERLAAQDALGRITMAASIAQLQSVDVVIEAISEDLELKRRLFTDLERAVGPEVILATNTSSLSVSQIAHGMNVPGRFLGLHFFNPATIMRLVEIVRTDATDPAVLAVAHAFVESLGKTAVEAADTPGFIVNRVARPYYLQALHALENGIAPAEDLDALARGAGFAMGPFELMDLIGLDINLATTQSVYERTGEERLAPVATQVRMVGEGKLGRKTSAGFYAYPNGRAAKKAVPQAPTAPPFNEDEVITVLGYGDLADQIVELLSQHYAHVLHVAMDDQLDEVSEETTILFDIGDGTSDRGEMLAQLDRALPADTVIYADAYATPLSKYNRKFAHPERFVGYGIVGSFDSQQIVEIVDLELMSDDALGLAEELFAALQKHVTLVADSPGLFLGRAIASIVNEAVYAVQEEVATADDIDVAMRLGTNYPLGPIAWGREIGGARVARILVDLANAEGHQYGPARALWVLDAQEESDDAESPLAKASYLG
ncbi:MAG: 3-hydroxyacyl-CoA dehydrogenase NAD-binding domain-containing protein [Candidatus Eremiobacteraeota bacterium]|nr:3-hydroxyacyl-CoA dehydrogenase NAD-binding domain-containing protein [Candidatus Eremiobacteraeota bacterium]